MDALDARRIDKNFEQGTRIGEFGHFFAVEFEREIFFSFSGHIFLVVVGAQRRLNNVKESSQDAVFVSIGDVIEGA